MTELTLPDLPSGFTPAFLTQILHNKGELPISSKISHITRSQLGEGTGMMAELSRLVLTYEGDPGNAPRSLVAKFASPNETNREIALAYKLYERETRFAKEIAPHISVRTARTFHVSLDKDRFLILMEDLTDYAVGSQVEGADLNQTLLAISELAKLHAAFWNQTSELDWIPHIADSYHATNMHDLAIIGYDGVIEKFAAFIPKHLQLQRDVFLAAMPELQQHMNTSPITLCHGDFRMENLLYGQAPGQDPVVVIDWQGPIIGRGMNDVALFLGQSTKTETRRNHERELIQHYLDGLAAGGVENLTFDDMWLKYREAVLYNWIYVAVVAGTLDTSNEKAYAWMAQMVARQSAATDDLDVFELVP